MSDSSDEDLTRFKEALDTSFVKLIDESREKTLQRKIELPRSERYLEEASHYNDVRVPKELQKQIGDKISAVINKLVEYVDIKDTKHKQHEIKGGVKLFSDAEDYLAVEEVKDNFTEAHNKKSKNIKWRQKRRSIGVDINFSNECEKIKASVVSGEYILSKKGAIRSYYRSRRKEKLFKYKAVGKDKNILIRLPKMNIV